MSSPPVAASSSFCFAEQKKKSERGKWVKSSEGTRISVDPWIEQTQECVKAPEGKVVLQNKESTDDVASSASHGGKCCSQFTGGGSSSSSSSAPVCPPTAHSSSSSHVPQPDDSSTRPQADIYISGPPCQPWSRCAAPRDESPRLRAYRKANWALQDASMAKCRPAKFPCAPWGRGQCVARPALRTLPGADETLPDLPVGAPGPAGPLPLGPPAARRQPDPPDAGAGGHGCPGPSRPCPAGAPQPPVPPADGTTTAGPPPCRPDTAACSSTPEPPGSAPVALPGPARTTWRQRAHAHRQDHR